MDGQKYRKLGRSDCQRGRQTARQPERKRRGISRNWQSLKNRNIHRYIAEGSLEVKLPTIWTDEKQGRAEAERREKIRREKSRRERVRRKKMQMREKVGKSRSTVFFQ